jgi:hypothetical protein
MHYECELAVVIGRAAVQESATTLMTLSPATPSPTTTPSATTWRTGTAPTCKVKNRDTCTPIGPWLVDQPMWRSDEPAIATTVNGKLTQSGSTKDMIFDVSTLIEYFSSFMTLMPGDLILTGTPDGVVDCQPGDVIVTVHRQLGELTNTISFRKPRMTQIDHLINGKSSAGATTSKPSTPPRRGAGRSGFGRRGRSQRRRGGRQGGLPQVGWPCRPPSAPRRSASWAT